MAKIIKNTTTSLISLSSVGLSINALDSYTIEEVEYLFWSSTDAINEVSPYILTGDIVVNNGVADLAPQDGVRFLQYADRATIQKNGTDVTRVNTVLNFEGGNVTVTDEGEGKTTVFISDDTSDTLYHARCVSGGSCNPFLDIVPLVDHTLCLITQEEC